MRAQEKFGHDYKDNIGDQAEAQKSAPKTKQKSVELQ